MQRPPDQIYSIPRIYRLKPPFFKEAKGGEFVEAYVEKRTKQISHEEKPLQEEFCRW